MAQNNQTGDSDAVSAASPIGITSEGASPQRHASFEDLGASTIATVSTEGLSEGASTQRSPERPWQPFIATAWPAERQKDLLAEQSELLQGHFEHFGKGLEWLHNRMEQLAQELSVEQQHRLAGEEQGSSALAVLRGDLDKKHGLMLQHVDESISSCRAEMLMSAGACDNELHRLDGRTDGLAGDINALYVALEKQRAVGDEFRLEMSGKLSEEHSWCQSSLESLSVQLLSSLASKSQFDDEVRQRVQACLRLEVRIEEECLAGLQAESVRQEASRELGRKECEALQLSLKELNESLLSRMESMQVLVSTESQCRIEAVSERIGENFEQCLSTLRDEECRRLAGDEALRLCTQDTAALFAGRLAETQKMLSNEIFGAKAESSCEAELLAEQVASMNAAQQDLRSEFCSERQQTSLKNVGLLSEMREVRCEFACELRSQEALAATLSQCTRQTSSLQQAMQEEESAHAALNDAFVRQTSEIRARASELSTSLSSEISEGLRQVSDKAQLNHEELWRLVGSVHEHTTQATQEMQELEVRTTHIEVKRLGDVSGKLEEFASLHGDTSAKIGALEQCSLKQEVALSVRLDDCSHHFARTREIVDGLVKNAGTRDFLESPNSQFRLYLTPEGDVAVHPRQNWGKWTSNDFRGIPCWHAGCRNDQQLCSVNRDIPAHEKDRFLALANREGSPGRPVEDAGAP